jgi:hypothetical protein
MDILMYVPCHKYYIRTHTDEYKKNMSMGLYDFIQNIF